MFKDIAYERRRTRDLLLNTDVFPLSPIPSTIELTVIYPWEKISSSILQHQIFQIALNNGFLGEETTFWSQFAGSDIAIGTADEFPHTGRLNCLYLDTATNRLYYYKEVFSRDADIPGAIRKDSQSQDEGLIHLYVPIVAYGLTI